jgi:hypothetical protein
MQYLFGENGLLDLRCESRAPTREKPVIHAKSNIPLTLEIIWESGTEIRKL